MGGAERGKGGGGVERAEQRQGVWSLQIRLRGRYGGWRRDGLFVQRGLDFVVLWAGRLLMAGSCTYAWYEKHRCAADLPSGTLFQE